MAIQIYAVLKFILTHPLNSKHKTKAIANFIRWQVGQRMLRKRVAVPWVDGSQFIVGRGDTGLTGNLYCGFMEYEDMSFLLHALRRDEVFVDVGANLGAYTILASKVVESHSIAFEPIAETVERLKDQIYINRINSMVDVRNMGVGEEEETLLFTNDLDTVNRVVVGEGTGSSVEIRVVSLDEQLSTDRRYFFKIDVEGFEYKAVKGAEKILRNNATAVIIELNSNGAQYGYSNEDTHHLLQSFGFIPVSYNPETRELSRLDTYNKQSGNTIYIRDQDLIERRCKSAQSRVIHTANGSLI